MDEVLRVENLHKRFGPLHVLRGIDLSVRQGRDRRHPRRQRFGQEHAAALRELP